MALVDNGESYNKTWWDGDWGGYVKMDATNLFLISPLFHISKFFSLFQSIVSWLGCHTHIKMNIWGPLDNIHIKRLGPEKTRRTYMREMMLKMRCDFNILLIFSECFVGAFVVFFQFNFVSAFVVVFQFNGNHARNIKRSFLCYK